MTFGSNSIIGGTAENDGLTIGPGSGGSFSFTNGAHNTTLEWTRFRSTATQWDLCDFGNGKWATSSNPVRSNKGNFHDISWLYDEFENPGGDNTIFNIWWDARVRWRQYL